MTVPAFEPLVVHRSTLRTWLISLGAIPFVVIGSDVLWRGRLVAWMTDFVFADRTPQTLDIRDSIWAWAMVIVGGAVVLWGLKELFFPVPVLRTDSTGLHLRLRGPLRPPITLPWDVLHDVDAGTLEDDEEELDVLVVEVDEPGLLPAHPWGARRLGPRTVAIFTREWDITAGEAATTVADQAVAVARST